MRQLISAILLRAVKDWRNGGDQSELTEFFKSQYCMRMFDFLDIDYEAAMQKIGLHESQVQEALYGDNRQAGFVLQQVA